MHISHLFTSAVLALSAVHGVTAAPTYPHPPKQPKPYVVPSLDRLQAIMPKSTLPTPDGLQLKFVGLGIGTQNYTCTTGVPTSEPGTTGAVGESLFFTASLSGMITGH